MIKNIYQAVVRRWHIIFGIVIDIEFKNNPYVFGDIIIMGDSVATKFKCLGKNKFVKL